MLDEISRHLEPKKARDLIRRLEDKRVDQVLPAEVELALLWALSRIGEIDIEPHWWGDEKRPDAYTEALVVGEPAVIEIAAPSDNAISGEEAMDGVALQIGEFASQLRRGLGDYLSYQFREESGYEQGVYFRRRLAPLDYELTTKAREQVRIWIGSGAVDRERLHIIGDDLDVVIEKTAYKQVRFHNTWSSMPPETHSVEDNPLYKLLSRKLRQLRAARPGTARFIFLGDAGSTLLNRLGQYGEMDPTRRRVSGREILSHFVVANQQAIDAIVAFAPVRKRSLMGHSELKWGVTVVNRPGFEFRLDPLEQLVAYLPRPRFEGYQSRSLYRQGLFNPKGRGWWMGMRVQSKLGGPMEAKVSARALMDLLAGRITAEQFRRAVGERPGEKNLFQHWLDSGYSLQRVTVEPGGLDEDDDLLVLAFADDPSARPLRLPDDSTKGESQ